jgi:sterol desaturase/sphingolipid hydroxylase (fatty acid hydroxylase superfamily)
MQQIGAFIFSHWTITFTATLLFFLLLYFGTAIIGLMLKNFLRKKQVGKDIAGKPASKAQIQKEIRLSLFSIFIFSLQAIPVQFAYQHHLIAINWQVHWQSLWWQVIVLFFWNELHFYASHWLLHRRWFYKTVHFMHHQSVTPTVFSTYSFHWFEAFLLGSVIFLPLLVYPFQAVALFSLPVLSITLNVLGHWHYDLAPQKDAENWLRFSFRHSQHHHYFKGNYGFFLGIFDKIFKTEVKKQASVKTQNHV